MSISNCSSVLCEQVKVLEPRDDVELEKFVRRVLGLNVSRVAVVEGNSSPFEYLSHSFFDRGDCVVWANRGGGKTFLGAVATLLDMVFKPGIQIRILGGSLEQSSKMYGYLRDLMDQPVFRELLAGAPTQKRIELSNGSCVEILSQSHQSVRGTRVHKLRCDEVELFKADIWQAAQMVTRSEVVNGRFIPGTIEALSTMHRPFGMMQRLVGACGGENRAKLFRWCALDVAARCNRDVDCGKCSIYKDCNSRARSGGGFIAIGDLITQQKRTSREVWESEMLCKRPRRSDSVYPSFNPLGQGGHVSEGNYSVSDYYGDGGGESGGGKSGGGTLVGGMDFGLRSPLVFLWAVIEQRDGGDVLRVIDEYVMSDWTVSQNLDMIGRRGWPGVQWVGVDPAGNQRSSHTGYSDVHILKQYGYVVRNRRSTIRSGVELIRKRLDHKALVIDPRCEKLIEAMTKYHFDADNELNDNPVKDGPDHLCDALRYMVVCLEGMSRPVERRSYF